MKEVSVQELKAKMDNKENFQLIDVREPHEIEVAQIGGEHIGLSEIINRRGEISKDKQVIIHCRSGARSANAVQALEGNFGFDNLYNLTGGILAWSAEIDSSVPSY
jgi:sulfur-carrier protein adenylyltransferase/sulfurtransferase